MPPSLEMPEALHGADAALRRIGMRAEDVAWTLLRGFGAPGRVLCSRALKKEAGLEGDEMERLLLWIAARQALPRVASLPVARAVRDRWRRTSRLLHPERSMAAGSYHFDRAAKLATLRRFPAGPMEWEPPASHALSF